MDNLQRAGESRAGEILTGLNEDTLSCSVEMSVALGEEHCQCCHHLNRSDVVFSYAGVIVLKLLT